MSETASLLNDIRALLSRFVVLPADHYYDAVALWTLHAHAIGAADTTPRLIFKSPEKESGKTRALEVLEVLVPAPLAVMNATTAAIFRLLGAEQATILFDEVDAIFNPKSSNHEDLRALLNAGYRRGATVARVVGEGRKMRVERFPVFAATALAAIGNLPDTIESRAIIVPMRRRAPHERVDAFRVRSVEATAGQMRESLTAWAGEHTDGLQNADPAMPEGVTDRAADCWAPLLAIAELAGADWTERARITVTLIVEGRVAEDASIGVRLLADVRTVLDGRDRLSSVALCSALNAAEDSQWGGWNDGKGVGPRDLARRLKVYGIAPKTLRLVDGSTPKGYHADDFVDSWARYLRADDPPQNGSSATKRHGIRPQVADVADVAYVGGRRTDTNVDELQLVSVPSGAATSATTPQRTRNPWRTVVDVADLGPLPDECDAPLDGPEPADDRPREWFEAAT